MTLLGLLQEAANGNGGFWPTNINAWAQLLLVYAATLAGIVVAFWKFLMKPVYTAIEAEKKAREKAITAECEERKRAMNGIGERVAAIATTAQTAVGKLEMMERHMDRADDDRKGMHENLGQLTAQVRTLADMMQRSEVTRLEDLGDLKERMVRMETKMDIAIQTRRTRPRKKEDNT